eukprot:TRINITY_DN1601_c0_g1_i7.p1 TRINITY_DN1601_c0_g1~~TRINITY_DN1601_c0_g1_i7.p1  ORF type:complete len:427 (-),score=66.46 TRINITY_DN1601_c0_g1_i7:353-1633(-)
MLEAPTQLNRRRHSLPCALPSSKQRCQQKRRQNTSSPPEIPINKRRSSVTLVGRIRPRDDDSFFGDVIRSLVAHAQNIFHISPRSKTSTHSSPSSLREVKVNTSWSSQDDSDTSHPTLTEHEIEALNTPGFDSFMFSDTILMEMVKHMFEDLGLFERFNIQGSQFRHFMKQTCSLYRDNYYHNFKHACDVAQMCYWLLKHGRARELLTEVDILIIMTAAVGHDLQHPGYNNAFLVKTRHDLAITYNDLSVLENLHASTLFRLLLQKEYNFLSALSASEFDEVRSGIIKCIMATDMANHQTTIAKLKALGQDFDSSNAEHRSAFCLGLLKIADISNPMRSFEVSKKWSTMVQEEFFQQGDMEKKLGLVVSPNMDRERDTLTRTTLGFMNFVAKPLLVSMQALVPWMEPLIINFDANLQKWSELSESA